MPSWRLNLFIKEQKFDRTGEKYFVSNSVFISLITSLTNLVRWFQETLHSALKGAVSFILKSMNLNAILSN